MWCHCYDPQRCALSAIALWWMDCSYTALLCGVIAMPALLSITMDCSYTALLCGVVARTALLSITMDCSYTALLCGVVARTAYWNELQFISTERDIVVCVEDYVVQRHDSYDIGTLSVYWEH
jgi:hypothetical protein